MRRLEDLMNWLTDMDWGWWPIVSLRPAKDKDIDNRVLLKVSPVFGGVATLVCLVTLVMRHIPASTIAKVAGLAYLICSAACLVVYKFSFAYFWNRRAKRLRDEHAQHQPTP